MPVDLPTADDLPESRLYTFIDEPREFALYFLEAQKLIHDLALIHDIRGDGFAYFRDAVLSVQLLIAFLKHGDQFGFYFDSNDPLFRLKIETGYNGETRCALIPEEFSEFPETLRGMVRVMKLYPNNRPPYESILDVTDLPFRAVVNHVLQNSYQVNGAIALSPTSDQSLMVHQLPPLRPDEYEYSVEAARSRRGAIRKVTDEVFQQAITDGAELAKALEPAGFRLLASRPIKVSCSCSKERMVRGVHLAVGGDIEQLFDPMQEALDVTCEYCKTHYAISRGDLAQGPIGDN